MVEIPVKDQYTASSGTRWSAVMSAAMVFSFCSSPGVYSFRMRRPRRQSADDGEGTWRRVLFYYIYPGTYLGITNLHIDAR